MSEVLAEAAGIDTWESDMSNPNDPQRHHGHKMGRRGDPRMHRAVAARLTNSSLSLYEALRMGGFDYPTDDDSSFLDSEQVSLGQRKNQLSRRVRLAKKHGTSTALALDSPAKMTHVVVTSAGRQNQLAGTKHCLPEDDVCSGDGDDIDESTEQQRTIMAKFHPQYHPIIVHPPTRPSTSARVCAVALNTTGGAMSTAQFNPNLAMLQSQVNSINSNNRQSSPRSSTGASAMGNDSASGGAPVPTGVAVASLSQTAANVGLTLEQLAWTLQTHTTLAQVLASSPTNSKTPKELAMIFYQNECRTLYQKCMLQAGFSPAEAQEGTTAHLKFALDAWTAEGQRLQRHIKARTNVGEAAVETNAGGQIAQNQQKRKGQEMSGLQAANSTHDHSQHDHGSTCGVDGVRHIHRLEGKCGHKAIVHQPPDGSAHIDFVVGDQVECYHGVQPVAMRKSSDDAGVWPSRYTCEDLSCSDNYCAQMAYDNRNTKECLPAIDPKTFNLSDIDFDGKEWNYLDTNDASLAGLFKLQSSPADSDGYIDY